MMRFLALALTLALGLAEEAAEEKKVGDVIGIDLGTQYRYLFQCRGHRCDDCVRWLLELCNHPDHHLSTQHAA